MKKILASLVILSGLSLVYLSSSFIEKGKVRLFIPKEDKEKEITFGFSFQGELVSAYDSFLTRTPSLY